MTSTAFLITLILMARPLGTVTQTIHVESEARLEGPTIEISDFAEENVVVTVTCSAVIPYEFGFTELSWNLPWDSENIMEDNADDTYTITIQENITLSDKHDGLMIICSTNHLGNESEDSLILDVEYSPKDTAISISPTDPLSVGSVVNLTCSCRANPPIYNFGWMRINNDRFEFITSVDEDVYSFVVTDSDRGCIFFCYCENTMGLLSSTGHQLTFKGDEQLAVGVHIIVKILVIVLLISTMIVFEWWFRSRYSTKAVKDTVECDYINSVTEV